MEITIPIKLYRIYKYFLQLITTTSLLFVKIRSVQRRGNSCQ